MKKLCVWFLAFLFVAGAVYAQGDQGRNYDARIEHNIGFLAEPDTAQRQAESALRKEIPGAQVRFDVIGGVARSVSNPSGYLTEATMTKMGAENSRRDLALAFAGKNRALLGLTTGDLGNVEVTDEVHSSATGSTHVYMRQTFSGIPTYNGQLQVNVNRDGRVMGLSNAFVRDLAQSVNTHRPEFGAAAAIAAAAEHLGLPVGELTVLEAARGGARETRISAPGLSTEEVKAQLMWLGIRKGETRLVWNFQLALPSGQHWYDINVDAVDGKVWTRFDWVSQGSYRVYQQPDESPLHGSTSRVLVSNPELSGPSPNGWFSGGTMSGNNVTACPDTSPANNACDSNPQCSGTTCDFPINLSQQPSSYVPAATANLFYWNNYIHDTQYLYGFDEAAGNFQENNFGRGGAGSDSVNADAQDGSGNCNANFATPTDGGNPRMQMFTCNMASPSRDGDLDNGVIVHEYGHGISIRQVGGPGNSSCLNNTQQPGEGWSDWFALVYTAEPGDAGTDSRGIGTYLFGQAPNGPGIRDLPYSTNNSINNWTYESIASASVPHGVGSRWAQAIWEVYWALVAKHGFDADLQNTPISSGNQRALLYVNEGLKNTACSPTFLDTRDGIIQAVNDNFGGEDLCDVWAAFADFGLGVDATTGGPSTRTATNGFSLPAECGGTPPPPPPPPPPSGTCPSGWTTWTGTATSVGQNLVTSTFTGSGGSCSATLSCDAGETGTDLDLYLDQESCNFFGCSFSAIAGSTSANCAESISTTCPSATLRWRVNVFSLAGGAEPFTICTSPGAP